MLIQVGYDIEPDQLASRLVEVGYERSDMVSAPGNSVFAEESLTFTR